MNARLHSHMASAGHHARFRSPVFQRQPRSQADEHIRPELAGPGHETRRNEDAKIGDDVVDAERIRRAQIHIRTTKPPLQTETPEVDAGGEKTHRHHHDAHRFGTDHESTDGIGENGQREDQ